MSETRNAHGPIHLEIREGMPGHRQQEEIKKLRAEVERLKGELSQVCEQSIKDCTERRIRAERAEELLRRGIALRGHNPCRVADWVDDVNAVLPPTPKEPSSDD